jgi:hypothetical protein
MPSLWTILDWLFYGLVRYVLYLIPGLRAPVVDRGPPGEWWRYNDYYDWAQATADGGHPALAWIQSWLEMTLGELARYATEKAKPYVDALKVVVFGTIGGIRPGFPSMGGWVQWLQSAIGYLVPAWAGTLGGGLIWLRDRFPSGIRLGFQSWYDIWEEIKSAVRSWAMDRYDAARSWASQSLSWISDVGDRLKDWRDRVAGWIDHVKSNPMGWIEQILGSGIHWLLAFAVSPTSIVLSWLAPDWPRLVTFAQDCLSFYYGLWSSGWQVLADIVADPRRWIMERLESAIMDRW